MRISNRKKIPLYNFIHSWLLIFLLIGTLGYLLEELKFNILGFESYLMILVPAVLLVLFYLSGRQIFEYDSEGEAVHFRNRNIIPFLQKPLSDEFPKYKLISYETVSIFFVKRLYITISSKNNLRIILKYDISFLNKEQIKSLKFSLNNITKTNKEKRY